MPKNTRENKFPKLLATRVPKEVWEALRKLTKERQQDFARYSEADAVRSAIINHLKAKGFLDKDKNYL